MPSPGIKSFRVFKADERFGGEVESREECLREAAECDRLAGLASTQGVRTLMMVAAFQWRKLAEKAAEREKTYKCSDSEIDVTALLNVGRS